MSPRRRLPGTRWRFLAHGAPARRDSMYGPPIELRSDDSRPSVFDEIVVDSWLHVEQQSASQWWMDVAGVTVWITVDRDGRPTRCDVFSPGDYADPVPGCAYRLGWDDPALGEPGSDSGVQGGAKLQGNSGSDSTRRLADEAEVQP